MGAMSEVLVLHVADSALEPIYSQIMLAFAEAGIASDFFQADQPLPEQFAGKKVVVDIGGWGRKDHVDAATAAGVQLWHVVGYGLDHLALDEVMASGIPLSRTPGTTTAIPLAEHAMYLLLSVAKQANLAPSALQEQHFFDGDAMELAGRSIAIVGLGTSGRELALRAKAFGMRVLGVDVVDVPPEQLASLGVERCHRIEDLHEVLSESDVVSLHLPLNSQTRHVLNATALGALRPGAIVVNVARGPLIDEKALIASLQSGHLGGAGLDVFEVEPLPLDSPLFAMPNVVISPHWAAATLETMARRARLAAENVQRVLAGQQALYRVLPEHL